MKLRPNAALARALAEQYASRGLTAQAARWRAEAQRLDPRN